MYPRLVCIRSEGPDLLLECVLMDSAFNGNLLCKSISSPHIMLRYVTATVLIHIYFLPTGLTNFL